MSAINPHTTRPMVSAVLIASHRLLRSAYAKQSVPPFAVVAGRHLPGPSQSPGAMAASATAALPVWCPAAAAVSATTAAVAAAAPSRKDCASASPVARRRRGILSPATRRSVLHTTTIEILVYSTISFENVDRFSYSSIVITQ